VVSPKPLPTFPNGFPDELIHEFEEKTGHKVLCNKPYSGTQVLKDYGEQAMKENALIVYTSADSVFQVAANEEPVPVHELSMMMSIALRFIPILIEETDKIMKAQMARGANFEDGNLIQKAKSMVPLLIPLFVSAFRRADDLAMAMEARCYSGGEGRTKMKPLRYQGTDRKAYVILIAFLVLVIVARVLLRWPQ